MKYGAKPERTQGRAVSENVATRLEEYLAPLLASLNSLLDKRLVKTFLGLIAVIISFRGYRHGLLLSELGGYLLPQDRPPQVRNDSVIYYMAGGAIDLLNSLYGNKRKSD